MIDKILSLEVGESIDYKPFLCTYTISKVEDDLFEIDNTVSGWVTAKLNTSDMKNLISNPMSIYNLTWK